jgi:hypothetical protein
VPSCPVAKKPPATAAGRQKGGRPEDSVGILAKGLLLKNSRGDPIFTQPKIAFTAADLKSA